MQRNKESAMRVPCEGGLVNKSLRYGCREEQALADVAWLVVCERWQFPFPVRAHAFLSGSSPVGGRGRHMGGN